MKEIEKKPFWKSKTKLSAALFGFSAILGTIAGIVNGSVPMFVGLQTVMIEGSIVLGIFGIRDLPFVNKK